MKKLFSLLAIFFMTSLAVNSEELRVIDSRGLTRVVTQAEGAKTVVIEGQSEAMSGCRLVSLDNPASEVSGAVSGNLCTFQGVIPGTWQILNPKDLSHSKVLVNPN